MYQSGLFRLVLALMVPVCLFREHLFGILSVITTKHRVPLGILGLEYRQDVSWIYPMFLTKMQNLLSKTISRISTVYYYLLYSPWQSLGAFVVREARVIHASVM